MARPFIEDLEWDDANEDHLAKHLDPGIVDDMIRGHNWVQVRNKKRHSAQRIRFIGREPGRSLVTVVRQPTEQLGLWRPVTGWWSTKAEVTLYRQQKGGSSRNA